MIARLWSGRVPNDKASAYVKLMHDIAIPDYRRVSGNQGAWCLHRVDGEHTVVSMLTFWIDYAAIERFAGTPIDTAKYYDFDPGFLVEMTPRVEHYEVISG